MNVLVGGAFHENRYHIIGDRFLEGDQIQGLPTAAGCWPPTPA